MTDLEPDRDAARGQQAVQGTGSRQRSNRRRYTRPRGDVALLAPSYVPLSPEHDQGALAALADLLAPLFGPDTATPSDRVD